MRRKFLSFSIVLVFCMSALAVSGQTTTPYAEKAFESDSLGGYWGIAVADIDGDGTTEILAMGSNNVINIYSATDYTLKGNITIPDSGGTLTPVYDKIEVGQADSDAALEIICVASSFYGGFVVIDGVTEVVEWERTGTVDTVALADVDGDGMVEIVGGDNTIIVFDVDTQMPKAESENITYWGNLSYTAMFRDIQVADIIPGGSPEIVAIADEFSGTGRLYILDSQTMAIMLNISVSGSLQCMDIADVDGDGSLEIIIGEGGVNIGSLTYYGHVYIYDSAGTQEYASADLTKMIDGIVVADIDNDGNMEIVLTSDNTEIWKAGDKSTLWSGSNLITMGEDDGLELADLDGDGKLDIITRAESYSSGNRVIVYKVNGIVVADTGDTGGDAGGDAGGDLNTTDDGGSGEGLGIDLTYVTMLLFAMLAVVLSVASRRRN